MSTLTEQQIINIVFSLYETDTTGWDSSSSEYLAARNYCNAAIKDWASRDTWRDLWTSLASNTQSSPTLVKTTTTGTWAYTCPTDFSYPNSWVRTTSGTNNQLWTIIPTEMIAKHTQDYGNFVYFTGSVKDGFVLNFNPLKTLTTGETINYEYYKTPTLFTATSSTTEIPDPYYLVYYTLARFLKNDGEDFSYEESKAREIIDNMTTNNIQGYWDINNPVEESLNLGGGFGV
jgi:hypothetical protein